MKSHDNPVNPDPYVLLFMLLYFVRKSCNPDALSSILHIELCVPVDFITDLYQYGGLWFYTWLFFPLLFFFSRIYFPTKITYVTMSFTLPKRFRENPGGFQRYFLADHVRWCCMHTEQYYQKTFVIPSTILDQSCEKTPFSSLWWKKISTTQHL